jgi:hypothetical protein
MAELLLTTGALLRLGPGSELQLTGSDATAVSAVLCKGDALVEAVEVMRPASIRIQQGGVSSSIETPGLYDFNARQHSIIAYAGSVLASRGFKQVQVPDGAGVKTSNLQRFATEAKTDDPLYAWSRARSRQLSLESAAAAGSANEALQSNRRTGSWYWDPLWGSYTFLSASGHANGPFGWPFYAPGHSHDNIPKYPGGDTFLYGPPVRTYGGATPSPAPPVVNTPTVPLTAPGVPAFPTHR